MSSSSIVKICRSGVSICKNYVVFVALLILLVAGMLSWIAGARMEVFHQHYLDIGHESVKGVEKQVAFYITEKRRMVKVFTEEQIELIRALASDPENEKLRENMWKAITHYFPDRFAFTVADRQGEPLSEDFTDLVGNMCLSDVKQFSQVEQPYHPYIHPSPSGYHFDIMVRYGTTDGEEGVFFISFLADALGSIINSIQSPNHKVMLVLPQNGDLIEVVAEGSRNQLVREDYRLSAEERDLISMRQDIAGTRWQVVDFHNPDLHTKYKNKLIVESASIFIAFFAVAVLLVFRLRREERQREFAEKQKQVLLSMISHEFRSPAAVVQGALDLVEDSDDGGISAETKKYIDIASSGATQLLLLVNDFLELQQIESGHLVFDKNRFQLKTFVENVVETNMPYAKQFSARYNLKEPLANDYVLCDKQRIEQVLTNFLSNAAKYGGDHDTIEIAVTRVGEKLRVSVTDHGLGIPEDFQPRAFDMFAMAYAPKKEQTINQKVKSSGLGLSIAKAIIIEHGGSIGFDTKVDTQSDTGTTFWFELPIV